MRGVVLAQRLRLAEQVAGSAPGGAANDLYERMPVSDLPAAGVDPLARRYFEQGLALAYGFDAPNSGLALFGLAQAERKLGHAPEAQAAEAALDKVWVGDRAMLRMDRI